MNSKQATARVQMAIKEMLEELDGDMGNMSILLNEYLNICNEMSNDIEKRLQQWLDSEFPAAQ